MKYKLLYKRQKEKKIANVNWREMSLPQSGARLYTTGVRELILCIANQKLLICVLLSRKNSDKVTRIVHKRLIVSTCLAHAH